MQICYSGFDEAGLGPLLGPLSIAHCSIRAPANCDLKQLFSDARIPVADSKKIHQRGKPERLEEVALAAIQWLTGKLPRTAADVFALFHESADQRNCDWMQGAEELRLPLAATAIPAWHIPHCEPLGMGGRLLQPIDINNAYEQNMNKSTLELDTILALLSHLPLEDAEQHIAVDRLGGRAYYSEALHSISTGKVTIVEEVQGSSAYRFLRQHQTVSIAFLVKGEDRDPLIATASCMAKYARELHMLLFNTYWSRRLNWLKHTAGYPQDANRWLFQLGKGLVNSHAKELVRGLVPDIFSAP